MSPPDSILKRLFALSDTYIETGTYHGDGALLAMRCGFKEVHSIEFSKTCYMVAKDRCAGKPIILHFGDSAKVLPGILSGLDHAAVIFLDAHNTAELPETAKGNEETDWALAPLRHELKSIADAPVKNHIIVIDDVDLLDDPILENVTMDEINATLNATGTKYQVEIHDGNREKSLLVAIPL